MKVDLTIDKHQIKKNGAIGVIVMFGDNEYRYIYSKEFMLLDIIDAISKYADIEVYVTDIRYNNYLKDLLLMSRQVYAKEIHNVKKYPELTGEKIVAHALENISNHVERYGLYLSFETLIV